jgi:hypothetical protein
VLELLQNLRQRAGGQGVAAFIQNLRQAGRGKRAVMQEASPQAPAPRAYGVAAQNFIDKVKTKFNVANPEVQKLMEFVCDTNPITKNTPVHERLYMIALGECEILNTTRYVSEQWIKMMKMEKIRDHFDPICPKPSCCKATDLVNIGLLCPGGGIAKPLCNTATCKWDYDCTHKTLLLDSKSEDPVAANAFSEDIDFSAFLDEEASFATIAKSDFGGRIGSDSDRFASVSDSSDSDSFAFDSSGDQFFEGAEKAEAEEQFFEGAEKAETEEQFFEGAEDAQSDVSNSLSDQLLSSDSGSRTMGILAVVVIALPFIAILLLLGIVIRMARRN